MGQKSGRNGAPAPQSRVSLSESKPGAYFCLLECVRSFLLGVFLRIRSRPFSLAVRSRAILCARFAGAAPFASRTCDAGGQKFLRAMRRPPCGRIEEENCADVFAISTHGPREGPGQNEVARVDGLPGKARRVHSRVHADAEETELRATQSRACAPHQLHRGDHIYSRRRSQLAGALHRAGARRAREGPAGRALSHRARNAGRRRRRESQAGALEVWSEAAQGRAEVRNDARKQEVAKERFRSERETCHAKESSPGAHKPRTRCMTATSSRSSSA